MHSQIPVTDRTKVRRVPARGVYDRSALYAILDEGLVAHVGVALSAADVFVLPMAYVRCDEALYVHGSKGSRLMNALARGAPACVTVTIIDGLVLARSAFHHSMNYRAAMAFGHGTVADKDTAARVFDALMEKLAPGRSRQVRAPNAAELAQTMVIGIPLEEASAKIRTGGPKDDPEDMQWPVWAGHVPLTLTHGSPVAHVP